MPKISRRRRSRSASSNGGAATGAASAARSTSPVATGGGNGCATGACSTVGCAPADDASAIRAAAALGSECVIEIGADASPLQRYSAIAALAPSPQASETAIVERVLERASRERLLQSARLAD